MDGDEPLVRRMRRVCRSVRPHAILKRASGAIVAFSMTEHQDGHLRRAVACA